ncbi:unnamed protein product (macronuclear) [Paramecium tetraurelia]|uniref:Transmembrane protein n=1 Tax=Paramecium tetraurelia TaxID=5888 RepID=A0BF18_PARTE|nr:uncharacterized protein GSPATT00028170001 [Paramecium tetraurelia]CAK57135.1 unnamed protein product [Paramecium tetraurelia]|eukprot:XP_001424533.1 hypothetical protein (macronuclear) [Paramecium tetraurelia strain d4-2]
MKIGLTIFCIILYASALSCVSNVQYYDIFASENETQEWDMNTLFFTGESLKFNITQESNFFEVLNPLHQLGSSKNAYEVKILSFKPLHQNDNGGWANAFAALGQNQTYYQVLYSQDGILNQVNVPIFNESIRVREITDNFRCFDLDFISETKIVIDCTLPYSDITEAPISGFFIIDVKEQSYFGIELLEDTQDYNDTQYRILQFHKSTFENQNEARLLFRSEPAWGTQRAQQKQILEQDSKINVFSFTSKFTLLQPTPVTVLTKTVLAKLLGVDEGKFTFQLVDLQIEANGRINVLDAFNGVYVLNFKEKNQEWQLENVITSVFVSTCFGFNIHNFINKDGTVTQRMVLVYTNKLLLLENGLIKFGIQIPVIEWYNTFQIKLTQHYIILKIRKTIYIYKVENGKKVISQEEDFDKILANPNYEDVIGINSLTAKRFFLNDGLLKLNRQDKATSNNKIVTLKAETIEQPSKQCSLTINLKVLKQNDPQILNFNNNPINPIITIPSNPLPLEQIASGPNLQFTSVDQVENELQDKISYTIQQVMKLSIGNIHMPDPSDVIYQDILVNENPSQFYLLFQVQTKIVYIYTCQQIYPNLEITECQNYNTFGLPSIIDQNVGHFSWFTNYNQLIIIHQNSQFIVNIYSVMDGKVSNVFRLMYDDRSFLNKISSVAIINDYIYIVQSGLKKISIYQLQGPYQQLLIIDQDKIQRFEINGSFTPIKVFGHKSNNLAFIQTQTSLLVGAFSNKNSPSFEIYKDISISAGSELGVAIGVDTFFVVQTLKGVDRIEEYNYQHLQNIFKLKDLPLFNYKLQKPLTVDYSLKNGWLYLRATDGLQTVILVYEPNVLVHSSLNKVIETKRLVKDGLNFDFAVDGGDQMFLYYKNLSQHQFVSIFSKPFLYFTPKADQADYVNNQIVAIQIAGFSGVTPLYQQSLMTILNTQSQLFISQSLFDSKKKIYQFVKQSGIQFINMGNDWYSGQVTNFDIKCSQCTGSFHIISNIYKVVDGQSYGQVMDGASFGLAGQVYQTRNALMFEDINGQFKLKILMDLKTERCNSISISADYNFILSAFQNANNEAGLFIHKCKYQDACSQFRQGIQTFKGLQKISKTYMPDSKNIIILNSPDNFSVQQNFIVVANLDDDGTQFTISHKYVINYQFVATNQLFIGDFDLIKYQINNYVYSTLLFTDTNNGIYFAHFTYNDQGQLFKTSYELFKLINFSDDQFFINQDTKFQQVKVISSQLNGNILQLNVLITTNNQAQYVFAFDLDASKPSFGLPIKKSSTSLLYVLTPYGNWPSLNKASYIDGNVAIPYTDGYKVVIGIYPLTSGRPSSAKITPFTHSISADYHKLITSEDFFMIFNKNAGSNYPYLSVNINYDARYDEYLVEKYQMRSDPQIVLSKTTNYPNELVINLYLKNDFNQIQGQTTLQSKSSVDQINNVGEEINFLSLA